MASAGFPRRIPLALAACLVVVAVAFAFALARRPAPGVDAQTTEAPAQPAARGVAAPPPDAVAPAASAVADDFSDLPLTGLPLRLLGTVVQEDAALSLATIEDLERSANAVISEGQRLEGRPSVRLSRIERARVLLDNHGVLEQLVIVPGGTAPIESAAVELTPEERERRRDLSRRLRELTDAGSDALGRGERGGLLAEGDVSAVYGEDGEMVGVQFDGIRAGGVYDRIGLRNGDVITDINGVSLGDPGAAALVLAHFASSNELVVSLHRDGSPETLRVVTEAFEKAVQEFE